MGKIDLYLKARQYIGRLIRPINNWFQSNPAGISAAAKVFGIPGASKQKILGYIKEHPFNSILLMAQTAELTGLLDMVFETSPELQALYDASLEADTIKSLGSDVETKKANFDKVVKENSEQILKLTLSEVAQFKDERELIDRVLARMPGGSHETRLAALLEFRKVMMMPMSNFMLYSHLRELE